MVLVPVGDVYMVFIPIGFVCVCVSMDGVSACDMCVYMCIYSYICMSVCMCECL